MKWPLTTVFIEHEADIVSARQRGRGIAGCLGFELLDQTRVATAVSEIARNAFTHAGGGKVEYGVDDSRGVESLVVRISDTGPGMDDPSTVINGRSLPPGERGVGVPGARRLMDHFEFRSSKTEGTTVLLAKQLPLGRDRLTANAVAELTKAVARLRDDDQRTALREQNRELLRSLAELTEREEETRRLNRELAETNSGVVALYGELDAQAMQLRQAGSDLEQQVAARTAELEKANDRLRAEATERERIGEVLRQSQKMEAVGQLTGGLAHDFNNLLAGISGSLEMMQTRIAQGHVKDLDRYMTAAQGAARRAAALTHRLLAFSRRQTLEPRPTDVHRLVAGMEDLIQRTVGPSIAVETTAETSLWSTLVDPNQLENALLNLCINSRDAMPDGGRIAIEIANRALDDRAASQRDMPPGDYVSLSVSDDGVGMPQDVVERIFEPFFTTKPIGLGTGLGLSMIFGFAKQSGGQVRVHSEVGKGTTVTILLPRHGEAEVAAAPAAFVEADGRAGTGKVVLVIDDEPLVRMLVVDVLEDLGYTAIEAGDGPQGMKAIRSADRIDLMITDVGLPNGMNGRQVADAAREVRPDLKVLFVTGYAETAVLNHGHLDTGMHIITKPFEMTVLARRIQDLLGAG